MRWWVAIAVCLLPALGAAPSGAQNLAVNGGFEEPVVSGWAQFAAIPGWTVDTGPGLELQHGAVGSPAEGAQLMELDSTGSSSVYQDFATIPGQGYLLRIAYSPRPGVTDNRIEIFWDGASVALLDGNGSGLPDTEWSWYEYALVASSAITRLRLADRGVSDSLGGYLDDVCVTATGWCSDRPLSVRFDRIAARHLPGRAGTEVVWRTLAESGATGFVVERAERRAGPFTAVGGPIRAEGAGHRYRLVDPSPTGRSAPWYRVVELGADGRGDVSPVVRARGNRRR